MSQRRKLAAILSADVVGYSRLMGDDEQATLSTLTAYRQIFAQHIAAHEGRVVDSPGDALLADFPSAMEAVECAIDIQRELAGRNASVPEHRRMRFRIGVNLGDVTEQDGALYGDGVNIAARLESLAEAGGICVSGSVYDQVEGKLPVAFEFAGEQSVKNIAKPVRTYRALLEFAERGQRAALRLRPKRTAALATGLVGAVLVIAAVGWYAAELHTSKDLGKDDPVLAMPTGPGIAVLPFDNLTGDPKQDYFVDGVTEQIITDLTRFRDLRVIARNSTLKYKGQAVDVRQVGRELGATYILEGSIRRAGDTIRVTAQLLDARHGGHLWAETYERAMTATDVFKVQDDITQQVVGAVGGAYGILARATFEQSRRKTTASLDAYECVLRAYEYYKVGAEPEHRKVRECLERAVELDPSYADAWAVLSNIYAEEHYQGFNPRPDPLGRARDAARRAINLDPNNQRAHEALAIIAFFRRDLDAFFPLAERAVALNPNYEGTVGNMGTYIVYGSWTNPPRQARGLALIKKAMALNPSYPRWYHFPVAWVHCWKGEYGQALAEAKKIDMPDYFWTHKLLAVSYAGLGRKKEAAAAVANVLKLRPDMPVAVREEWRKWNVPDEVIDRVIADLRRAGMNIPEGT
jgi:adenylate cyclase